NHNSRSPDGEIVAGRGFWPGLCVSLKHNSKFATFTILAKGDYPVELNIGLPFSLVSNDQSKDRLIIMPAYWFLHNMYALARNAWKYADRDKRINKTQLLEFDYLAPDSINELVEGIAILQQATGKAYLKQKGTKRFSNEDAIAEGKRLLDAGDPLVNELEILVEGFENSGRPVQLIKVAKAYTIFKELISFHAVEQLIANSGKQFRQLDEALAGIPAKPQLNAWMNIGGQLIRKEAVEKMVAQIHQGKIKSWDQVHAFYQDQAAKYPAEKFHHAVSALNIVHGINLKKAKPETMKQLLQQALAVKTWMTEGIYASRAKDYKNPFRKMVYETTAEMNKVLGKLEDNSFIKQEKAALEQYKKTIASLTKKFV
ncbi:MAG TPA: hypothetical protein VM488_17345, partial [Pseudobacter sp.]|nr:hypothetical protein [Pseudobacter sp.]